MTEDKYEHARQNAASWLRTIENAWKAKDTTPDGEHPHAENLALMFNEGELTDTGEDDIQERVEEWARERPLSVQVRGKWYEPGSDWQDAAKPVEYEILLSTGGPALRLRGDLGLHGEPETADLEMQDWGVPWREYTGDAWTAHSRDALMWFAGLFYYGGGLNVMLRWLYEMDNFFRARNMAAPVVYLAPSDYDRMGPELSVMMMLQWNCPPEFSCCGVTFRPRMEFPMVWERPRRP